MCCHRYLCAVRKNKIWNLAELLDSAEDVIPAATVQTPRVFPQLVQDFIHLKSCQDSLDQYRGFNRALGNAQFALRQHEYIVPETRFQVAFKFRQVEVRPCTFFEQCFDVVEKVQAKIEDAA